MSCFYRITSKRLGKSASRCSVSFTGLGDGTVRTDRVVELLSSPKHTLLGLTLILDLSQTASPLLLCTYKVCNFWSKNTGHLKKDLAPPFTLLGRTPCPAPSARRRLQGQPMGYRWVIGLVVTLLHTSGSVALTVWDLNAGAFSFLISTRTATV